MPSNPGLFYARRLENRVLSKFIFTLSVIVSSKSFAHSWIISSIPKENNMKAVRWFQVFLSNTNNYFMISSNYFFLIAEIRLYTVICFQVYQSHDMAMSETYIYCSYNIYIEHSRNTKNSYDFSVQVRNFLLPLSLKVFRHRKRGTIFLFWLFHLPHPISCDTCPRPPRASESQPSSPEAGLISTNWLFQNLPKSSACFRCVRSFALASPVSHLRLLWHLWVTRLLRLRTRVNTCVNVAP